MDKLEKIMTIFIFIVLTFCSIYILVSNKIIKEQKNTINELQFEKEYIEFVIEDNYYQTF